MAMANKSLGEGEAVSREFLVLDCNYLTRRAQHAFPDLEHAGEPTGVVYGFLREIKSLEDQFPLRRFVFCWDHGPNIRCDVVPAYKAIRREKAAVASKEEREAESKYQYQVNRLKNCYLEELGYRNSFAQWGREADDLIAAFCQSLPQEDRVIIVGCDKDLYQCLDGDRVIMWLPQRKRTYTERSLREEYHNITPPEWAEVKALAGCASDNVPGIEGVGDKTAAKFLAGQLPHGHKIHRKIREQWKSMKERNLPLVQLPYSGTIVPSLRDDETTPLKWKTLSRRLGFRSFLGGLF